MQRTSDRQLTGKAAPRTLLLVGTLIWLLVLPLALYALLLALVFYVYFSGLTDVGPIIFSAASISWPFVILVSLVVAWTLRLRHRPRAANRTLLVPLVPLVILLVSGLLIGAHLPF